MVLIFTVRYVIHNRQRHKRKVLIGFVDAPPKLPRKEVHTHDAEDEPEDEADEEDIHDGWDGTHQGIYHHLGGNAKGSGNLHAGSHFCLHSLSLLHEPVAFGGSKRSRLIKTITQKTERHWTAEDGFRSSP